MKIEIRTVEMDPENEKAEVHFETEKGHRFNKVIKIDEETDTKDKLRKHIESMAAGIAAEFVYDEVTFEFQTNAFFYEPPEGEEPEEGAEEGAEEEPVEDYTESQLESKTKDELTDIANDLDIYEEGMDERSYTKADVIEKILEAQE